MQRSRWVGPLAAAAVAGLFLAACGGGGAPSHTTSQGAGAAVAPNTVTISNFMFSPMTAAVAPGTTVKVVNKDAVTHTLTATGGQFDTGDIAPGQTKTFTAPTKPGSYHYICNIHQYMMGTIQVR
ncbi:MAG TPA: cupredoxin domain-containing protein [Acidimicrobiales bacterium]